MKLSQSILLLGLVAGTVSCQPGTNENSTDTNKVEQTKDAKATDKKSTKADLIENIEKHERVLKSATDRVLDANAKQLVSYYMMYAKAFPTDSLAPEFIFKAADVSTGLQDFERAVRLYNKVENEYEDYIKHPESIYLAGFIYDNHMGKKGKAKEYYDRIIEKYPNHIFAKDAKAAIAALHMTDEELVKMFEEKNKAK